LETSRLTETVSAVVALADTAFDIDAVDTVVAETAIDTVAAVAVGIVEADTVAAVASAAYLVAAIALTAADTIVALALGVVALV
jgi:hypothetical protein